jgi:small subunit ribosomal protein S2
MKRQPDAVVILDLRKEQIAVREAKRLGLPVIALVDTNCDPDDADFVVPGNDDAIRACSLIVRVIADAVDQGRQKVREEDFRKAAEKAAAAEVAAAETAAAEAAAAAEPAEAEAAPEEPVSDTEEPVSDTEPKPAAAEVTAE